MAVPLRNACISIQRNSKQKTEGEEVQEKVKSLLERIERTRGVTVAPFMERKFMNYYREYLQDQKNSETNLKLYLYAFVYHEARLKMRKNAYVDDFSVRVLESALAEVRKWKPLQIEKEKECVCNLYSMRFGRPVYKK